jgi:CBS domain-containing protein
MEANVMGESSEQRGQRPAAMPPTQLAPGDPVHSLVSLPIMCAEPHAALSDLARQLGEEHVGALLVMEGDQLAGMISERDLVRVLASGDDARDVWIADVMALDVVQVDGTTPIGIAALAMLENGTRHLAVTSEGRVIGIVSMRDVLRVLTDHWLRS